MLIKKKSEFKGQVCNFLGSLLKKKICYTHKYTLIRVRLHFPTNWHIVINQ